jgi:glutamate-ammonia-ligase adenylyltransferase
VSQIAGTGTSRERFSELIVLAWSLLAKNIDPDLALNNWARYVAELDDRTGHFATLLRQPRLLELMLQVFATSQFLASVLIRSPELIEWALDRHRVNAERTEEEMLADIRPMLANADPAGRRQTVRWFRRREILRIGTRDVCLGIGLETVTREISALARAVLQSTLEAVYKEHGVANAERNRFTLLAFGKLGGNELNYSSDIDLLGVYEPDASRSREEDQKLFASVLTSLRADLADHTEHGYAYRVDFRLRPFGTAGPLAPTTDAVARYYERDAGMWELQASLKLARVAGALPVAEAVIQKISSLSGARVNPDEVRTTIEHLRTEAVRRAVKRGHDIKNGPGGIRDIEFVVQGLQLTVLPEKTILHEPNTLAAIRSLAEQKYLSAQEARVMSEDYVFLRRVEHALQLFEDQQIHTLPEGAAAGALGCRVFGRQITAERFLAEIDTVEKRTRARYERFLSGRSLEGEQPTPRTAS